MNEKKHNFNFNFNKVSDAQTNHSKERRRKKGQNLIFNFSSPISEEPEPIFSTILRDRSSDINIHTQTQRSAYGGLYRCLNMCEFFDLKFKKKSRNRFQTRKRDELEERRASRVLTWMCDVPHSVY